MQKFWQINLIALITIVRTEVRRFMRIWTQTLLPPAVTITLYFIIFGHFIGSRIGNVQNVSFMQFIAPGLIMMAVINNSFANVAGSFYALRFQRSIEELIISPTPNYIILLGYMFGGIIRGMFVGVIITIIALFFTHLSLHHAFITIFIVLITAALFSLAGFFNAVYARSFDDIMLIPTFVLTPLVYLGGVFFSIHQLSPAWQFIAKLNPILYLVDTFRYGILGVNDVSMYIALSITISVTAILFFYNLYLLKKGTGIRT